MLAPYHGVIGLLFDCRQGEQDPLVPGSALAYGIQRIDVLVTVVFEVFTEIEKWNVKCAPGSQDKRHQEAAKPAIAIHEGMDRFELIMDDRETDKSSRRSRTISGGGGTNRAR